MQFPLPVNARHKQTVSNLIASFDATRPLVAIAPGAKRSTNRWPADRFADITQHLKGFGANIILVGGLGDKPVCSTVNELSGNTCLNLAGITTLLESAALFDRCQLVIACDSGVQHLAATWGTPCISLFSARDICGKWIPHGRIHTVIRKWPECHTCFLDACPRDNLCMRMISTEEVIKAINEKLKTV